jgi:hypothetical protein
MGRRREIESIIIPLQNLHRGCSFTAPQSARGLN